MDLISKLATYDKTSSSLKLEFPGSIFSILKIPEVRVPVLSNITLFIFFRFCNLSKFLKIKPSLYPNVEALYNTIGVAKPRAHGHAITRTEIAISRDLINSVLKIKYLYINVAKLNMSIPGTKNWVTLSRVF